jgi:hypothetical protein
MKLELNKLKCDIKSDNFNDWYNSLYPYNDYAFRFILYSAWAGVFGLLVLTAYFIYLIFE